MTDTTTPEAPASQPSAETPVYRMAVIDFATGAHRMVSDDLALGVSGVQRMAPGAEVPAASGVDDKDPWSGAYGGTDGVIEPRYSPAKLLRSLEMSETLATVVEAMTMMVEGTGTVPERYKPDGSKALDEQSDEVIEAQRAQVLDIIDRFDIENPIQMRRASRAHLYVTGFRVFEVVRDRGGKIAYLHHVSSATVRATPLDKEDTQTVWHRRDPATGRWLEGDQAVTVRRRFRRWAQVEAGGMAGKKVWFKEFGDPRDYDRDTGKRVNGDAYRRDGKRLANEVIVQVTTKDPFGTPYGVPFPAAVSFAIDGNYEAAKVNFKAFLDGFRIPLLVTIVGGFFAETDFARFKEQILAHKGSDNFHMPLVLPVTKDVPERTLAGSAGTQGNPVITVTKLRDVFPEDHTHEKYQTRNDQKIGQRFRLPPVFRGATEGEYTFATIWASLWVFEKTVGALERPLTDDIINRLWLPEEGIHLWVAKTQGIPVADLSELNAVLTTLIGAGVVTPDEVRGIASRMADIQLDPIDDGEDGWSNTPLGVKAAPKPTDATADAPDNNADDVATDPATDPANGDALRQVLRDLRVAVSRRRMKPRGTEPAERAA